MPLNATTESLPMNLHVICIHVSTSQTLISCCMFIIYFKRCYNSIFYKYSTLKFILLLTAKFWKLFSWIIFSRIISSINVNQFKPVLEQLFLVLLLTPSDLQFIAIYLMKLLISSIRKCEDVHWMFYIWRRHFNNCRHLSRQIIITR